MRPPRPEKPAELNAPGLVYKPREDHWVLMWQCRSDIAKRGYEIKAKRLWPYSESVTTECPTENEWNEIASQCELHQAEMLNWGNGGAVADPRSIYDGTMASLIAIYLSDPESPFQSLRFHTKHHYESHMSTLTKAVGKSRLDDLTFRDFKRWHREFQKPVKVGLPPRVARAHGLMTKVRILMSFGKMLKLGPCKSLKDEILDEMTFPNPKPRSVFMTVAQAVAIRHEAHRQAFPSIALAQAFQFELMLRQKDVIGEWLPVDEPGLSDVVYASEKWLHGLHWNDIVQATMTLTKRLSKSLRGRDAIMDAGAGKTEPFDLNSYPMIVEELRHTPPERRAGPVIVCEYSDLPWRSKVFQSKVRKIATAAGVPNNVQNRDSRAGGVTEAMNAGARPDQVRRHAGHSQLSTTMLYSRDSIEAKNEVADIRSGSRVNK